MSLNENNESNVNTNVNEFDVNSNLSNLYDLITRLDKNVISLQKRVEVLEDDISALDDITVKKSDVSRTIPGLNTVGALYKKLYFKKIATDPKDFKVKNKGQLNEGGNKKYTRHRVRKSSGNKYSRRR
jgi:hypothetical protein